MSDDSWPSIDVITEDLNRRDAGLISRVSALETKAGLNLGFASVLISQLHNVGGWSGHLSAASAFGSMVAAILAMWPIKTKELSPIALRDKYLMSPVPKAKLALFDYRADLLRQREKRFGQKVMSHRGSTVLLVVAALLFLAH